MTNNTKTKNPNRVAALTEVPDTIRYQTWQDLGLPTNVHARLHKVRTHEGDTLEQIAADAEWLLSQSSRRPLIEVIDQYLTEADTFDARCDRWAILRTLELMTKLPFRPPVRPDWECDQINALARPLRPQELATVRAASVVVLTNRESSINERIAAIGAFEAGATAGELPKILSKHIIFGADGQAEAINLQGTERREGDGFPAARARAAAIPAWARPAFTTLAAFRHDDWPLLFDRGTRKEVPEQIESTLLMKVNGRLKVAGLDSDRTVKPASIRNGIGRQVRDRYSLEAAADFLGHESFDSVSMMIGLTPRPQRRRSRK